MQQKKYKEQQGKKEAQRFEHIQKDETKGEALRKTKINVEKNGKGQNVEYLVIGNEIVIAFTIILGM